MILFDQRSYLDVLSMMIHALFDASDLERTGTMKKVIPAILALLLIAPIPAFFAAEANSNIAAGIILTLVSFIMLLVIWRF